MRPTTKTKSHRRQVKPRKLLAIVAVLASADHRAKDIRIGAVITAELKLGGIQRQIFGAHFVECADNTAFEDRPETFNHVGIDSLSPRAGRGSG